MHPLGTMQPIIMRKVHAIGHAQKIAGVKAPLVVLVVQIHSHRLKSETKVKNVFGVCRFFFDRFCLRFSSRSV